ncbi:MULTISPECIES: hypothetical protein [unclassified Thiocapsa]|uniref:hypothetical protein n=1 Tax=unclassified Thiocapsa TaxID=2641286 RepID=UPI0035AD77BA
MEGERKPSRAAVLLVRDLVSELHRCGKPVEGDDFAHKGIALSHQLGGVVRYAMRCDPVRAADVVHAHRWHEALLHLVAADPSERTAELTRMLSRANEGRTPLEVTR